MKPIILTPLGIATIVALIVGLIFAAPFLPIVVLSALMAFLFFPIYHRLKKRTNRPHISATITLLISTLVVLIPIVTVLLITLAQLSSLSHEAIAYITQHNTDINTAIAHLTDTVNHLANSFGNHGSIITDQGIRDFLITAIPVAISTITDIILGVVGNIPSAIVLTIMYIVFFLEFLIYGKKIVKFLHEISPFDTATTSLYLRRVSLMTNAMAKGQLLISLIISLLSAILMIFLGLGEYFFILFVLFTVLNLIPLGCGIVLIPITLIAIVLGNVVPGIIVLALYMVVSNLDSILRPKIMSREASLSAGLTMIAAFGGITAFGLLGVIYGPVIMILVITTLQLYRARSKNKNAPL
jgi:predicted PurR-regulated permease PerM